MTRRKKTDGERIAEKVWARVYIHSPMSWEEDIARDIDRLIRKRMAKAWEEGWFDRDCNEKTADENPYRERSRKK